MPNNSPLTWAPTIWSRRSVKPLLLSKQLCVAWPDGVTPSHFVEFNLQINTVACASSAAGASCVGGMIAV